MIGAIIQLCSTLASWAFGGWKKKNDASVPQRDDQVAKDYTAKRKDLESK